MPTTTRTTEALRFTVHDSAADSALARGSAERPVLLMVHGLLSSQAQWQPNLAALAEVCTPVTVDLWGHGASPAPENTGAYLPDAYLEQFDAIREALGVERWFLCGYSLGAGLTIRYAMRYPQRVWGHVFTNSASAFALPETQSQFRATRTATLARFAEQGMAAVDAIPVHPRKASRLPAALHEALLRDAARLSPSAVGKAIAFTNAEASVRAQLADNTRPALLAFGRYEKRFADHATYARAHMPQLRVVELDAGHAVNAQDIQGFNDAVTQFIGDVMTDRFVSEGSA